LELSLSIVQIVGRDDTEERQKQYFIVHQGLPHSFCG
jgi:large subunit ribosomal protein L24